MSLPFTVEQFLQVLADYNLAVWPMQIILNLFAVVSVILVFTRLKSVDEIISGVLAFFWLWIGIAYHLLFFTTINNAAYLFGAVFILQALIFIYHGLIKDQLQFKFRKNFFGVLGIIFLLYAIIIYPILGYYWGHVYPQSPTFGLPCPTTIFTFGILLFTVKKFPRYILLIPFLWSLIGFSAAVNIGITEDFGLVVAGVIGTITLFLDKKKDFSGAS